MMNRLRKNGGIMINRRMICGFAISILLASITYSQEDIFNVSKETELSQGLSIKDSGVHPVNIGSGSLTNVAGSWSFNLSDTIATRSLKLMLYQNNDAVFGFGDITILGNSTSAYAGGTIKGNNLTLYVISDREPSLYKIETIVGPDSMDGNYIFSTKQKAQERGKATGGLAVASSAIPIVKTITYTSQVSGDKPSVSDKMQGPKGSAV
jgi:hypothetical protein